MSTHAVPHVAVRRPRSRVSAAPHALRHALWLGGGLVLGFLLPFVFADTLELNRDLFYGLYGVAVLGFVGLWSWSTGQSLAAATRKRLVPALGLGLAAAAVLAAVVYRTEDASARADGLELVATVAWRGVVYGAVDGILLSVFPILAVFAAFAGAKLRERIAGKIVVGAVALAASLAMTAVYHAGYSEFRSGQVAKPMSGDLVWSAPTLLTLNPVGAPIAHVGLHTAAVLHSPDTELFLPPHGE